MNELPDLPEGVATTFLVPNGIGKHVSFTSMFDRSYLALAKAKSVRGTSALELYTPDQMHEYARAALDRSEHPVGSALTDELLAVLKEARIHLPIAAASWNEDEDPSVAGYHVKSVLDLIAKVDALLAATPSRAPAYRAELHTADCYDEHCAGCVPADAPDSAIQSKRAPASVQDDGYAQAPGNTDAERAAWLADKIAALGDYAREASSMLYRWPTPKAALAAVSKDGSDD